IDNDSKVEYLGSTEFKEFYCLGDGSPDRKLLGDLTWNLGIARNFALDHSISLGYEKLLFIDDDISDIDERKVEEGFSVLKNNSFVSCILKGLEDNSIIGHIAKHVGVIDDGVKFLSGGFLFFSPATISKRFYNIYNEDWIIQLLENKKKQILLPYTVRHNVDRDVNWTLDQAIFQEFGELVVEGLLENENAISMDYLFWGIIIENRIKFIQEIKEEAIKINYDHGHNICNGLLNWLQKFDGYSLRQLIEQIKNEQYEHKI
ncbi:hypothetical protein, partial [Flavobacterium filum]|uniref:hypothetical protein n=1 Tax=Flavobacterium filum TaxID=370974 RepID=UPI0023F20485